MEQKTLNASTSIMPSILQTYETTNLWFALNTLVHGHLVEDLLHMLQRNMT